MEERNAGLSPSPEEKAAAGKAMTQVPPPSSGSCGTLGRDSRPLYPASLCCLSFSCLPSAKVRQSPSWHGSWKQKHRGHVPADPKAPKAFPTVAQGTGVPTLPRPYVPGAQPARKEAQRPLSHCLSSRGQPSPSWGAPGFPKHTASYFGFSSSFHGFTPLARAAVGSEKSWGALQYSTPGGRKLLMLPKRRQGLFSSSFPPQLLLLISLNLPKLFKDRGALGVWRRLETNF